MLATIIQFCTGGCMRSRKGEGGGGVTCHGFRYGHAGGVPGPHPIHILGEVKNIPIHILPIAKIVPIHILFGWKRCPIDILLKWKWARGFLICDEIYICELCTKYKISKNSIPYTKCILLFINIMCIWIDNSPLNISMILIDNICERRSCTVV